MPSLIISVVEDTELMNSAVQMDMQLCNYMHCSKIASNGQLCFGLATDKASVCGLGSGVQTTICSLPGNLAIYAPPQALFLSTVVFVADA